jgi:hypothetical protein
MISADEAQGIAIIIGSVSAFIVSVGTFVMQYMANRRLTHLKEMGQQRDTQLSVVHDLVNGQNAALLNLTEKAAKAEGAKEERDAAESGSHV